MTSFLTPLYLLSAVVTGLMYLIGVVVAVLRWRDYPRPSKFLLIALLLMILSFVISNALTMLVANVLTPTTLGAAMMMVNLGRTVLHVGSFGFMVAAVYVDRVPASRVAADEFLPGDQKQALNSPNPFATPE